LWNLLVMKYRVLPARFSHLAVKGHDMHTVSGTATRKRGRPVGADSAETRQRILEAARRVVNQRGYQGATFQAIAIEAGLTRPSVLNYFESREQIYYILVAEGHQVMADCIAAVKGHDTLRAQLASLNAALYAAERRDRSQMAFLVSARIEGVRHPELNFRSGIGLNRLLKDIVRDAAAREEIPADTAVEAVADMLQALMWGMGFYAGFIDTDADMAPLHALLERLISRGLPVVVAGSESARDTACDTSGDTPRSVVPQP
jgi:AcrR family transcriptional regulator